MYTDKRKIPRVRAWEIIYSVHHFANLATIDVATCHSRKPLYTVANKQVKNSLATRRGESSSLAFSFSISLFLSRSFSERTYIKSSKFLGVVLCWTKWYPEIRLRATGTKCAGRVKSLCKLVVSQHNIIHYRVLTAARGITRCNATSLIYFVYYDTHILNIT